MQRQLSPDVGVPDRTKDLFSLQQASHRLWVACKSLAARAELLEDCEVACTACARCAVDAPNLVAMQNNLPVVDYSGNHDTRVPIERCPTGAGDRQQVLYNVAGTLA